jgi:hypothetical protein
MMKKILWSLALILILPVAATAYEIGFTDATTYAYDWRSRVGSQNHRDVVGGYPDITGGSLTIDDQTRNLTSVTYNFEQRSNGMGDLFIDVGNDNDFDYVFHLTNGRSGVGQILAIDDGVLSTHRGDNWNRWNDLYLTSNEMSGLDHHRYDHFVALDLNAMGGDDYEVVGTFNATLNEDRRPWHHDVTGSYLFSDFDLEIEDVFTMNFAPHCANDVIQTSVVPLPSALLLLGGGILGLIGVRRRSSLK